MTAAEEQCNNIIIINMLSAQIKIINRIVKLFTCIVNCNLFNVYISSTSVLN